MDRRTIRPSDGHTLIYRDGWTHLKISSSIWGYPSSLQVVPPRGFPAGSKALLAGSEAHPVAIEAFLGASEAFPGASEALPAACEAPFKAFPPCLVSVIVPYRATAPITKLTWSSIVKKLVEHRERFCDCSNFGLLKNPIFNDFLLMRFY